MPRIDDIRLRRDTLANWNSVDPTLNDGELALVTDQRNFRVGDGVTAFSGLVDWITGGGAAGLDIALIRDEKSSGTNGGVFSAGAWRTRDLNTIVHNDIGLSLASNQITMPAGDYLVIATAPAYDVRNHQTRLQNITDAVTLVLGSNEFARDASQHLTRSMLIGYVSLPAQKIVELQHRCNTSSGASNGFGVQNSFGPEIYSQVLAVAL